MDGRIAAKWWAEADAGDALVRAAKFARDQDETRLSVYRKNISIYLNRRVSALDAWAYASDRASDPEVVRLNIAKSVLDTVDAQLTKNWPRSSITTDGATWGKQRQAKRLEQFIDGVKYRNQWARKLGPQVWVDVEICGAGIAKVFGVVEETKSGERIGRVRVERVYPWEVFVDPVEAHYGSPRSWYQFKVMDRELAANMFSDHKTAIRSEAKRPGQRDAANVDSLADQVLVVEGWHLPSFPGAKDGAHLIAIDGISKPVNRKADRAWDSTSPPFVIASWTPPVIGYWGDGLVEEVRGMHAEINELQQKEQVILAQTGRPVILNFSGTPVDAAMDDSLGIPIINVDRKAGADPEAYRIHNPPALNGELRQSRAELIQLAYQLPGVSQMSASSMKPSGLDAAVAIREFHDLEAERFSKQGKAIENLDLDVSHAIVRVARELAERGIPVEVTARTRRRRRHVIERIKWKDVDLSEDAYEIQVFPASQLPRQPAGRLAMVEQLIAAGFLEKQNAMRLLDWPDVQNVMDEQLAPINFVLDVIEAAIEEGRYIAPIAEQDLQLTIKMCSLAIQRFTLDEAPEDRVDLLRKHAAEASEFLEQAEQAAAQSGAGAFVPQAAGQLAPGLPQGAVPDGQAAIG